MKFNFNYHYTNKRLENSGEGTTDKTVTEVIEPEVFTLDSVVGDSFFTKIKSKINCKSGQIKKEHFYDEIELNEKVSEFRSLLQREIIKDSENFLKGTNFSPCQLDT